MLALLGTPGCATVTTLVWLLVSRHHSSWAFLASSYPSPMVSYSTKTLRQCCCRPHTAALASCKVVLEFYGTSSWLFGLYSGSEGIFRLMLAACFPRMTPRLTYAKTRWRRCGRQSALRGPRFPLQLTRMRFISVTWISTYALQP